MTSITNENQFLQSSDEIITIYNAIGKAIPNFDSDEGKAISILSNIINEHHKYPELDIENGNGYNEEDLKKENISLTQDLIEKIEELESNIGKDDFYLEYDGNEYRLIADSDLWEIYVESIKNLVSDCYDIKLDNIPSFVEFSIDWEKTAKNCLQDGYAHTFSTYDGDTHIETSEYNIFYTN